MSARVGWSRVVDAAVWAVAASGCALSYNAIQSAAVAHVDFEPLSYLLPLATDGAAIAAAARYVLDRRAGLSGRGWQAMAWSAIGASIVLNVVGRGWQDALWHVAGPAVLAAVTELYAHRAARQFVAEQHQAHELEVGIPRRLWLTAPVASWRLWLWMARTGTRDAVVARVALGRYAAAREALRAACAGRAYRRMRRVAARQLRAATLAPAAVLDVLGWSGGSVPGDAPAALRALLATALAGSPDPSVPVEVDPVVSTDTHRVEALGRVEPVEVDGSRGRVLDPTGGSRSGRVEISRGSRPAASTVAARTAAGRGRDEAQVRWDLLVALREGRLSPDSSVEEVRRELGMAWRTARPWQARLAEIAGSMAEIADSVAGVEAGPVEPEPHGVEASGRVESRGVDLDPAVAVDPAEGLDPVELVPVALDRPVWEAVA